MINYAEYCNTENQKQIMELHSQGLSSTKIQKELKLNDSANIRNVIRKVKTRASKKGYAPEADLNIKTPTGFEVKGTSTLYDNDGNVKIQWVKTNQQDNDRLEALKDAVAEICENVQDKSILVDAPKDALSEQMAVYTIGDAHLGLWACKDKTGKDSNTNIMEVNLKEAMHRLVDRTPSTDTALIVDVGDFFHTDNSTNQTNKNHNILDIDSNWSNVLATGLKLMTTLVNYVLTNHKKVIVRNAIGNHNEHSAVFLSAYLQAWFRNNPRVEIATSTNEFWYYQFGKVNIGVTHGHKVKPRDLGEIMACDCEEIWSSTKFRYWYTGHIHHDSLKEYRTCTVESFRSLNSKDEYLHGKGYRSGQDMKCIILHKDFGEISRNTVNVAMLNK